MGASNPRAKYSLLADRKTDFSDGISHFYPRRMRVEAQTVDIIN